MVRRVNFYPEIGQGYERQVIDTRWMAHPASSFMLFPGGAKIHPDDLDYLRANAESPPVIAFPSGKIFLIEKAKMLTEPFWRLYAGGAIELTEDSKLSDYNVGLAYTSFFEKELGMEAIGEVDLIVHKSFLIYENLLPEWEELNAEEPGGDGGENGGENPPGGLNNIVPTSLVSAESDTNMIRLIREKFETTIYPIQYA